MSWKFNPPPGWPEQPEGWTPPPGWAPDPSWPPPPAGWQFWVPADAPTGPPMTAPYGGTAGGPATPGNLPPGGPAPTGPPAVPPRADRHWATRWWGVLGLVGALLVGGLLGFGGTSLALGLEDEDETAPAPAPGSPTPEPEPSEPPLPTDGPLPTAPPDLETSGICGDVAVIMVQLVGDQIDAAEADDPAAALAESRRTAADSLRDIDTDDSTEEEALGTFADELDAAADEFEQGPATEARFDELAQRTTDAWDEFNDATGC